MAAGTPERWQALGCHRDFGEVTLALKRMLIYVSNYVTYNIY